MKTNESKWKCLHESQRDCMFVKFPLTPLSLNNKTKEPNMCYIYIHYTLENRDIIVGWSLVTISDFRAIIFEDTDHLNNCESGVIFFVLMENVVSFRAISLMLEENVTEYIFSVISTEKLHKTNCLIVAVNILYTT